MKTNLPTPLSRSRQSIRQTNLFLTLLLFCGLAYSSYGQTIRYVTTTGTNASPATATSWATSTTNLQGAIDASASGDQVWVAAGTYKPTTTTGPDSRTISFSLKNGVAIYGGFVDSETDLNQRPAVNPITDHPSSTTLSGDIGTIDDGTDNSYHVINNSNITTTALLDGFVITAGKATDADNDGGGMRNFRSSPTLTNCAFLGNTASSQGGGIYNITNSNPVLNQCLFKNNTASSLGGGMYNVTNSSPVLTNCVFINNTSTGSGGGGGMCNNGGNPTLTNCLFQDNSTVSANGGGGLLNTTASPTLVNCSFVNNTSSFGGGISNRSNSNPILTNCLFQNNSAQYGGGVYNFGGSPVLSNCSFLSNTAQTSGGAIVNTLASNSILLNCSFINNTAQFGGGISNITNSSPTITNCSFQNNSASTSGGGLYNTDNCNPVLTNCVLFNNGGSNTFFTSSASTLTATNSLFDNTVTGYTGTNNLTTNTTPFISTSSVALNSCAPAINTGLNSASGLSGITTDLVGNTRIVGGTVDMGAVEFQTTANEQTGIATQPVAGSSVCVGGSVTASVSVTGTDPFTYQWYKNNALISTQQSASLTLSNVSSASAGSYSVVVVGTCNSVTSTAFSLTVNALPTASLTSNGPLTCAQTSVTLTASGGTSYTFANDSGILGTPGPTNTLVVNSPGTYSVTVANAGGCTSTTTLSVNSNQTAPSVSISPSSFTLTCTTGFVSLSAIGSGTYLWSTGQTTSSIFATSSNTYSVTLTGANGCTATSSVVISSDLTAPPLTILLPTSDINCTNPVVSLTAVSEAAGTFRWNTGETSPVISVSTAGTYSVTLTGTNGCFANSSAIINADQSTPLLSISPSSATLTCASPLASLSAIGTGSFLWSTGSTDAQIAVSTAGPYSVTLTGVNGCSSTATTAVISTTAAISVTNPTVTTATAGTAFSQTFTASAGVGPYSFSLASGTLPTGLSLASSGILSGTATQSGSYSITVRATDANGCVGIGATYTLAVGAVADLSVTLLAASPNPVLATSPITFTAVISNAGPSTALGTQLTIAVPFPISLTPTPFRIVSLTNDWIVSYNTVSGVLTVYKNDAGGPTAGGTAMIEFSVTPAASAAGLTPTISASVSSGALDPTMANNTASLSTTITSANLVSLTLSSGTLSPDFAQNTTSYSATVGNVASLNITPTAADANATIQVSVNGGAYSPVASGNSTAPLALSAGTNLIEVLVTAQGGIASKTYSLTLVRSQVTLTDFAATLSAVCIGSPISFTATVGNVSGSYSYTLTNGFSTSISGSTSSPTFSQNLTASESGTQTFTLTVSNGGLSGSSTATLTVNALPTISISPSSATLTIASPTASLSAISSSGTLLWSTGETASVISVTASGTYSVTLTNPSGCTASASAPIAGADLTLTLTLPQANFATAGSVGNFLVDVFEVGGLPTSAGNVTITITAPIGYTLSFSNSLTSILVSGGSETPVAIDNVLWTVTQSLANRQLTLVMNSGQFIGAGHQSTLGFQITRTTANSGSTASITVNVGDDLTRSYDGNLNNNVYARIISGL